MDNRYFTEIENKSIKIFCLKCKTNYCMSSIIMPYTCEFCGSNDVIIQLPKE